MISKNVIGIYARGGLFAGGGGLFAGGGGLFAGGPFAAGLIAGGLFASGLNAATRKLQRQCHAVTICRPCVGKRACGQEVLHPLSNKC